METDLQKAVASLVAEQKAAEILSKYPAIVGVPDVIEILSTDRNSLARWRASGALPAAPKKSRDQKYTYRRKDLKPILVQRIIDEIEVWDAEERIRKTIADMRLQPLIRRACKDSGLSQKTASQLIDYLMNYIEL